MVIDVKLNTASINSAIKQIENYKIDLQRKAQIFLSELAEIGITVARANTLVEYDGQIINRGDMLEFTKESVVDDSGVTCSLSVTARTYLKEWQGGEAEVNPLLMAEFGSGSKALGDWRGKFPNQHVAFLNSWKWTDKSGQEHESSGNEPSRPLFKAKQEMERQILEVAYRVFST